jgi:hypothetical protein
MGQVSFSPQIQKAHRVIKAWSLLEKKVKGQKVSSRLLSRSLRKALLLPAARSLPAADISNKLKEAYQSYYRIKGSHPELRVTAMEKLEEAIAEMGNTTKEKVLKVLHHREKRASARKIRILRCKLSSGSTTMVMIQSSDGSCKDLTGKNEIETAIMENNQQKYQQSFHTPFFQSPLREEFGFKGSMACQAVLGGVYEPSKDIDASTQALIEELHMPQAVRDLGPHAMTIPLESYRNFWKKANKKISCYPSALSFATMKAGATDDIILEFECELINTSLASGYSPQRWQHLMDVMILKNQDKLSSPLYGPLVCFQWIAITPLSTWEEK